MQPLAPAHHSRFERLTVLLVVAALAAPITYLEVARPHWQDISDRASSIVHSLGLQKEEEKAAPAPAKTTAKTPAATSAPATTPAPAKTATTTALTHFRSGKGVTTPIITDLPPGTTVTLRSESDTTWQGVTYQGKDGFIYRAYLQY